MPIWFARGVGVRNQRTLCLDFAPTFHGHVKLAGLPGILFPVAVVRNAALFHRLSSTIATVKSSILAGLGLGNMVSSPKSCSSFDSVTARTTPLAQDLRLHANPVSNYELTAFSSRTHFGPTSMRSEVP